MEEGWVGVVAVRVLVAIRDRDVVVPVQPREHTGIPLLVHLHPMLEGVKTSMETVKVRGELVHWRGRRRRDLGSGRTSRSTNPRHTRLGSRGGCSCTSIITRIRRRRRGTDNPSIAHLVDNTTVLHVVRGKRMRSNTL